MACLPGVVSTHGETAANPKLSGPWDLHAASGWDSQKFHLFKGASGQMIRIKKTRHVATIDEQSALIQSALPARCAAKPALLTLAFSSFSEFTRMAQFAIASAFGMLSCPFEFVAVIIVRYTKFRRCIVAF